VQRRGKNIGAENHLFHHHFVQLITVRTVFFRINIANAVRRRHQKPAGAAGKIGNGEIRPGFTIGAPSHREVSLLVNRQAGQQLGRSRQRVKSGEKFSVGNQPLKNKPGKVAGAGRAHAANPQSGAGENSKNVGGILRVKRLDNIPGNLKNGPVIDCENVLPLADHILNRFKHM